MKEKDLSKSSGTSSLSFELCCSTPTNLPGSDFANLFTSRTSLTARTPPPPSSQVIYPWFKLELSEGCWLLVVLGPPTASSPVKSLAARRKTLIATGVSSSRPTLLFSHMGFSPITFVKAQLWYFVKAQLCFLAQVCDSIYFGRVLKLFEFFVLDWFCRDGVFQPVSKRDYGSDIALLILASFNNFIHHPPTHSLTATNLIHLYTDFMLSQEKFAHRISLTAGLYPGPLLASCSVSMSRTHSNLCFWIEIAVIENLPRFGSPNFPPSFFSSMFCPCVMIGRRLLSYPKTTSLICFCEYLPQTLAQPSSSMERTFVSPYSFMEISFLTPWFVVYLVPASLETTNFSSTSLCLGTVANLPLLGSSVVVSPIYHFLACGIVFYNLCLRAIMEPSSDYRTLFIAFILVVLIVENVYSPLPCSPFE